MARDEASRRQAAKLGRAYLGTDGRFHPEVVSPDLAGTVLAAAVREGDSALYDALDARLGTLEDSELRRRVIKALSATTDPSLSARALALSMDERLRQQERGLPLFTQAEQRETRESAWQMVTQQFDALVGKLSPWQAASLPAVAETFCDTDRAREVEAFFTPRLERIPGARRTLEQAVEKIRLCAALRKAQGDSARSFFEGEGKTK